MRLRRRQLRSMLLAASVLCGLPLRALALANPYVAEAGSQTLSFGWFGSGSFNVALSTEAGFASRLSSGAVAANTTAYFNLSINATHYFRVKQAGAPEAAYEILAVSTSAAAPGTPSFNAARFEAASSFTAAAGLAWETSGNPDWTSYEVQSK